MTEHEKYLRSKARMMEKGTWADRVSRMRAHQRSPEHRSKVRDRLRSLRLEVLTHYSGGAPRCACCGESHIEFLAIDHLDESGQAHRRRDPKARSLARYLKYHGLPAGYRVLCHNCNMAIGFYGRCPHSPPP